MTHLLPLTSRDKKIAISLLQVIEALVIGRSMNYRMNTLTHRELHSLVVHLQTMEQELGVGTNGAERAVKQSNRRKRRAVAAPR